MEKPTFGWIVGSPTNGAHVARCPAADIAFRALLDIAQALLEPPWRIGSVRGGHRCVLTTSSQTDKERTKQKGDGKSVESVSTIIAGLTRRRRYALLAKNYRGRFDREGGQQFRAKGRQVHGRGGIWGRELRRRGDDLEKRLERKMSRLRLVGGGRW